MHSPPPVHGRRPKEGSSIRDLNGESTIEDDTHCRYLFHEFFLLQITIENVRFSKIPRNDAKPYDNTRYIILLKFYVNISTYC